MLGVFHENESPLDAFLLCRKLALCSSPVYNFISTKFFFFHNLMKKLARSSHYMKLADFTRLVAFTQLHVTAGESGCPSAANVSYSFVNPVNPLGDL
jgi:hypothetical protein